MACGLDIGDGFAAAKTGGEMIFLVWMHLIYSRENDGGSSIDVLVSFTSSLPQVIKVAGHIRFACISFDHYAFIEKMNPWTFYIYILLS